MALGAGLSACSNGGNAAAMGSAADVVRGIGSASCPLGVDLTSGTDLTLGKSGGVGAQALVCKLYRNGAALNTRFTVNCGWGWSNKGSCNGQTARSHSSALVVPPSWLVVALVLLCVVAEVNI